MPQSKEGETNTKSGTGPESRLLPTLDLVHTLAFSAALAQVLCGLPLPGCAPSSGLPPRLATTSRFESTPSPNGFGSPLGLCD